MIGWRKRQKPWVYRLGAVCSGLLLVGLIGCGDSGSSGNGNGTGARDVTGTVIDGNGNPLAQVTVSIVGGGAAAAQTNASGTFTLFGVPGGDQTLRFQDQNGNLTTTPLPAGQGTVGTVLLTSNISGPPPPPQF